MISEFLFYDENAPKEEKTNYVDLKIEIRELLNNPFNRKVLTDILMDLRKDLSGGTLHKLFELHESLGLHHDSYKKLESWKWQKISKGISELTQMHVEESYVFITKFINDKRSAIRKQAEIAIITLKHEGLDFFLDTTTYRISEWQQLKILEVLKNKKNYQPPNFKQWLISKNKDVVLFALRLMKHYSQSDGNTALIELLKHKNGEIKVAAIGCIKEFNVVESVETLKLVFWSSSTDIKIALLDAISDLGTENDLQFLYTVSAKESNFNVKSKALASINAIAPMTIMPSDGIRKVSDFKVLKDLEIEEKPKNLDENDTAEQKFANTTEIDRVTEVPSEQVSFPETQISEDIQLKKDRKPSNEEVEKPLLNELAMSKLADDSHKDIPNTDILNEPKDSKTEEFVSDYAFKVDFLPLVTSKVEIEENKKYRPKKEPVLGVKNLREIELVFKEVVHTAENSTAEDVDKIKHNEDKESLSHDFTLLDFLPIVVSAEEIEDSIDGNENAAIDLSSMKVSYLEIKPEEQPLEDKIASELNELAPLPIEPIEKNKIESNVIKEPESPSSLKTIDMKEIRKIECEGIEIKNPNSLMNPGVDKREAYVNVESFEKQEVQNTLDWILSENEAKEELKQKIKSLVSNQNQSIVPFHIPKPIFYTEHEASTIALLDDIEALGDQREVALLETLLVDEVQLSLRKRIQELIEKISDTSVLKKESISQEDKVFSVFEEFFRGIDVDSKLILLDEIVAIGDEKEIPFLRRLTNDLSRKIGKKAQDCLEKLTARLVREKEVDLAKNTEVKAGEVIKNESRSFDKIDKEPIEKPFDVFEIEFDFSLGNQEETESNTSS